MRQVTFPARRSSSGDSDNARPMTILARRRYFETLGLSLLAGRPFNDFDGTPGRERQSWTQRFTAMFLRERRRRRADSCSRLGSRHVLGPWLRIVGVAPSVRQSSEDSILPDPVVSLPMRSAAPATTSNPRSHHCVPHRLPHRSAPHSARSIVACPWTIRFR